MSEYFFSGVIIVMEQLEEPIKTEAISFIVSYPETDFFVFCSYLPRHSQTASVECRGV